MVSIRTCRRHLCNSSVHPTLIRRNILIPKFIHRPGYVANTYPPLFLTCSILSPQVRASTSASWWTQCLILYDRMKVCISTNPTRDVMSYIILFKQSTREHPHAISLRYSPTMRRGTRLGGMPGIGKEHFFLSSRVEVASAGSNLISVSGCAALLTQSL